MLKLTRQADLGIVLLTILARKGVTLSAKELAESSRSSPSLVSKILKILAREGLLQSTRGQTGGYRLARTAEEITVAEMIRALEGPIALTACVDGGGGCDQECWCPVSANWRLINDALETAFSSVTLSAMAGSPAQLSGLLSASVPLSTPTPHAPLNP